MALNEAYFDAIHIEVVKKKYYNANKVEAVFADIKAQAIALQAENDALRRQIGELSDKKDEIGNALLCARQISRQIIAEANEQAESITARANEQAEEIVSQAQSRRDELVRDILESKEATEQRMEDCVRDMEQRRDAYRDAMNTAWQDFLCGLYTEDGQPPEDLHDKVSAIADALKAFNEEE